MEKRFVYADHSATTPISKPVLNAMLPYLTEGYGNPSSIYSKGREAKKALESARGQVAEALHAKPSEIYFTSCGTESDNWAIKGAAAAGARKGKRHLITTNFEHHAVLHTMQMLEKEGFEVTYLPVDSQVLITAAQVREAIRPDTALVSIMYANNEIGTILPIPEIGAVCREARVPFHTDAVQAVGQVAIDVGAQQIDMLSLSGHKLNAPKGVGALYIGPRCRAVRPLLAGGGQERGLRSGTEATAQIAGFAKAVELRLEGYEEKLARMAQLKQYALEQLLTIDGVVRIGNGDAPHILSVSLVGYPSANVVTDLGAQGICISAGSACHRGKLSHVYAAMKLDKKTAAGVLRVSFAPETTKADVDALVSALRKHKETRFPML